MLSTPREAHAYNTHATPVALAPTLVLPADRDTFFTPVPWSIESSCTISDASESWRPMFACASRARARVRVSCAFGGRVIARERPRKKERTKARTHALDVSRRAHLAAARRAGRRLGGLVAVVHRVVVHHFRCERVVARDPRLRASRAMRALGERAATDTHRRKHPRSHRAPFRCARRAARWAAWGPRARGPSNRRAPFPTRANRGARSSPARVESARPHTPR